MKWLAATILWVDNKLIQMGEEFTPHPRNKVGRAWTPIDDEAKAAHAAAGSPETYTGTVEVVLPSVPVDWQAAAIKAGWVPAPGQGQAPYTAAPPAPVPAPAPVSPPVAAPAAAPVEAPPAAPAPEHDDGAI